MDKYQGIFLAWSPRLLSVLRIVTAYLFMMHGSAKLLQIPHQAMFDTLQIMSLLGVQGVLELVGGLLLLVGLFSRPVAFLLLGDMAVAYFMVQWPKGWLPIVNGSDLAILYALFSLSLGCGPGPLEHRCLAPGPRESNRFSPTQLTAYIAAASSQPTNRLLPRHASTPLTAFP